MPSARTNFYLHNIPQAEDMEMMMARASMRRPPGLGRVPDAELIELALCAVLNFRPLEKLVRRSERLSALAQRKHLTIGSGKRCSLHQRCERLSCLICRRRAQLRYVASYTPLLKEAVKRAKRRGSGQ